MSPLLPGTTTSALDFLNQSRQVRIIETDTGRWDPVMLEIRMNVFMVRIGTGQFSE